MGVELGLLHLRSNSVRVFKNSVLRRIFVPKRQEVTGGWRRLHEEVRNLYASPNIIRVIKSRRMGRAGHVVSMGKRRNAYKILVGKPERNKTTGRPRHR
jgi:hypothetical protein